MPARAALSGPPRSGLPARSDRAGAADGAGDGAQRRRLAGAVGAEDGDDLALVDVERDPVQCLHRAVARLDLLELEQGGHWAASVAGRAEIGLDHGRVALHLRRAARPRSCGRSSSTLTWSEIPITRFMWCSTSSTVSRRSSRIRRMKLPSSADLLVVEPAGRLVEQQQPRPGGERAGDLDPLLRPVGERCRRPAGMLADTDVVEHLERLAVTRAFDPRACAPTSTLSSTDID